MQPKYQILGHLPSSGKPKFFSTRKRRFAAVVASFLMLVIAIVAVQSWQVVSAIMDMEQAAVVPLPPSYTRSDDPVIEPARSIQTGEAASDSFTASSTDTFSLQPAAELDKTFPVYPGLVSNSDLPPDQLSRLEVAQVLVEAGIGNGDPATSEVWNGKTSLTILVLGVDRRSDGGDQNADVIIVAELDLPGHTLNGVSIPRDLLVNIPGIGPDKINTSFNYGVLSDPADPASGVAYVRNTVEAAFGISIDGYILIDFDGFEGVVDALGGIDIDVPYTIADTRYPTDDYGIETVTFNAGPQQMDGDAALKYVRTRHADSDDARRQRQIDVILAILSEGKSLGSIAKADSLIVSVGEAIQTSFGLEEQLTLARLARLMSTSSVSIANIEEPLVQSAWTEDGKWVYLADEATLAEFVRHSLAGLSAPEPHVD
ncbi:hypothetical protein BH23CHL5_BH23CHL5_20720 [soil metagenome]